MFAKRKLYLAAGLLSLAALACNFPFIGTPTEPVFPTPDLTMTAVFLPIAYCANLHGVNPYPAFP